MNGQLKQNLKKKPASLIVPKIQIHVFIKLPITHANIIHT